MICEIENEVLQLAGSRKFYSNIMPQIRLIINNEENYKHLLIEDFINVTNVAEALKVIRAIKEIQEFMISGDTGEERTTGLKSGDGDPGF